MWAKGELTLSISFASTCPSSASISSGLSSWPNASTSTTLMMTVNSNSNCKYLE